MRALLVLTGVAALGCGAATAPTVADVAGTYVATTFSAEYPDETINVLAIGGSLSVTFSEDGTTSGMLVAPGGGENGQTLTADLSGTWQLNLGERPEVTMDHAANTFLREMTLEVGTERLDGQVQFGNVRIVVILHRRP